jgi:hypothetical protein
MKVPRKAILGIGLLLLFTGIIISLAYNFQVEKVKATPGEQAGLSVYKYNVTGFFNAKTFSNGKLVYMEKLYLELPPTKEYFTPIPFNVSIYAPDGSETVFRVNIIGDPQFYYYEWTLLKNDGGLEVEIIGGEAASLGGNVTQTGNYTAQLDIAAKFIYGDPPSRLILFKEIWEFYIDYPYRSFLPVGVVLIFAGVGLSIFAMRTQKVSQIKKRQNLRRYKN